MKMKGFGWIKLLVNGEGFSFVGQIRQMLTPGLSKNEQEH